MMEYADISDQAGLVFEQCDRDNKGYLDLDDFMILKQFLPMSDDQLRLVFARMDQDNNLRLYRDEFEDGFSYFLNVAQESSQKIVDDSGECYSNYSRIPDRCSEDGSFYETIEHTGVKDAFEEIGIIEDVWKQIQRENPSMLAGFENILTKVSSEIKKRKAECANIETAMKNQKMKQDEEIRRLYEEMENQIRLEKKKLQDEESQKERNRREQLELEIQEKDADYQEILRQHEETMKNLKQLQQQHTNTAQEKDSLEKERDMLESQLLKSDLTLKECQKYIETLKDKKKEDSRLRAKAAIDFSEGIALERENLYKQLNHLRELNRKLKDEQDESLLCAQRLLPGQESAAEILNIDNSKKNVKFQFQFSNKIAQMTPEQRRGSILSTYFNTVLPKPSTSNESDHEVDENVFIGTETTQRPQTIKKSPLVSHYEEDEITQCSDELESTSERINSYSESSQRTVQQEQKVTDAVYKVVFIGDSAVGKSSIHHRYIRGEFEANISSTIGVDFQIKTVDGPNSRVILQLWDTAGQEKFRSVTRQYYRKADGMVVVYDVTSSDSYLSVRDWISKICDEEGSDDLVIMILANKVDLADNRENMQKLLDNIYRDDRIKVRKLVSARSGEGIEVAFEEFVRHLKISERENLKNAVNFKQYKAKRDLFCCKS